MGWVETINVFCTTAETGRDSIQNLWKENVLLTHGLENIMMANSNQLENIQHSNLSNILLSIMLDENISNFLSVIENYIDIYCILVQLNSKLELEYLTRRILHSIDSIFPKGISKKKL